LTLAVHGGTLKGTSGSPPRGGSGAELTPKSVNVALAALRAYRDKLISPPVTGAIISFQIEALDGMGLPREVLAITVDERITRSALAKAKKRFPAQKIVLRAKTSSGERITTETSDEPNGAPE
jgi:hypothetical protein